MRRLTITLAVCLYSVALLAADGEDSAVYKRAAQLLRKKDFDAAEAALEEAREQYPDSLAVLSASAYCAEQRGAEEDHIQHYRELLYASTKTRRHDEDDLRRIEAARKFLRKRDPATCALIEMLRIGFHAKGQQELSPVVDDIESKVLAKLSEQKRTERKVTLEILACTPIATQIYLNGENVPRSGGKYDPRFTRLDVMPGDIFTVKIKHHANWFWLVAKHPSGEVAFSTASGWFEYTPEEVNAWWVIDKENPGKYKPMRAKTHHVTDLGISQQHLQPLYRGYRIKASTMEGVLTTNRTLQGCGYLLYVVKEEDLR